MFYSPALLLCRFAGNGLGKINTDECGWNDSYINPHHNSQLFLSRDDAIYNIVLFRTVLCITSSDWFTHRCLFQFISIHHKSLYLHFTDVFVHDYNSFYIKLSMKSHKHYQSYIISSGPFYSYRLTLILAGISNYIHYIVSYYCTYVIWEYMSNPVHNKQKMKGQCSSYHVYPGNICYGTVFFKIMSVLMG